MSVAQSERNVTEGSSSFLASGIPLWRACDSAMRGELTSSMMLVPVERDPNYSLVKHNLHALMKRPKRHLRSSRASGEV